MKNCTSFIILFIVILGLPTLSSADSKQTDHHSHSIEKSSHSHNGNNKKHHKMPAWAKTLTSKQKKSVDDMHHELDRSQKSLKEKEKQLQKELNRLTILDNADLLQIHSKIDALMAVKNEILRLRYAHLVEMRAILNKEQRISYDEAVLKRDKIK